MSRFPTNASERLLQRLLVLSRWEAKSMRLNSGVKAGVLRSRIGRLIIDSPEMHPDARFPVRALRIVFDLGDRPRDARYELPVKPFGRRAYSSPLLLVYKIIFGARSVCYADPTRQRANVRTLWDDLRFIHAG